MSEVCTDGNFSVYQAQRRGGGDSGAAEQFAPQKKHAGESVQSYQAETLKYRLTEEMPKPSPGTLEYFLLERYLLFAWDEGRRRLLSGQVHHTPYPPCGLELEQWTTAPIQQAGLTVPTSPPDHCIASRGVKVKVYWLQSDC